MGKEMGFWDRFLKAEKNIRNRVENAFGRGMAQTLLEVRREILEQVEAKVVIDKGGNLFPCAKVVVALQPPTEAVAEIFKTAFLQDGSLKSDIIDKLKESQAQYPPEMEVSVELRQVSKAAPEQAPPIFQLDFIMPDPSRKPEIPETKLVIVKGSAEFPEYRLKKERILVGRLSEVLDREGRMVRINDVVFLDNGDEINSTVGRAHARIWLNAEKLEFRIIDESSRYGTRIIRAGRSIEIPGGNTRGIRLRSGDEIYFGQACLRFELINPE
jgi:hypothetical protein